MERRSPASTRVAQARRIGALLTLAVAGYLLGGCAGDGSGLPALTGVTLPTGSLALPTGETETSVSTTTVTEPTTTTQPETTTVIETVTTEAETTTEATTTEIETESTESTPTEPATTDTVATDTVPTDTSEDPAEDEAFWRALALAIVAAAGGTDTETATTTVTVETPAPTTSDTSPAETVAAEPVTESDTPWGWIALGAGLLAAAGIAGFAIWRRRRRSAPPT